MNGLKVEEGNTTEVRSQGFIEANNFLKLDSKESRRESEDLKDSQSFDRRN